MREPGNPRTNLARASNAAYYCTRDAAGTWNKEATYAEENGDYHLTPASSGIDTGTRQGAPPTDFEGNQRPCWRAVDRGAYEYCGEDPPLVSPQFIRGDANGDKKVNIADAVYTLFFLYRQGPEPTCMRAADVDDDGMVDTTDALALFGFLFDNEGPLSSPHGRCGVDLTEDALGCSAYPPCR